MIEAYFDSKTITESEQIEGGYIGWSATNEGNDIGYINAIPIKPGESRYIEPSAGIVYRQPLNIRFANVQTDKNLTLVMIYADVWN